MKSRRHIQMMRKVAMLAAIILLLGQTIATAHFHPASRQPQVACGGVSSIADSSCAICAAHLHSPAASAIAPALDAPTMVEDQVASEILLVAQPACIGNCFGRAPPVSA